TRSAQSAHSTSTLHEELKMVLPQIQQRKNVLDIKKTPDIFIHQVSDVAEWLEAKGFSSVAQRQLRVPGHQLFALSRAQLERVLGADEGKRLYSHVLVQRNVSGVSARRRGHGCTVTPRRRGHGCTVTPRRRGHGCTVPPRRRGHECTMTPRRRGHGCR
ncbi:Epidermal growth factor receptor kinase substrate 8, partial [Operophtera brumata]